MRFWCSSEALAAGVARRSVACLAASLILSVAQAAEIGEKVVVAQGEAYRISTFANAAAIEIELRGRDGTWFSLRRPGGEMGWFGYNRRSAGEVKSSAQRARIERIERGGVKVVAVSCELEAGVVHRAEYVSFPDFCIVASELRARKPPADATLIRLAPRFDMDARRIFCYALRDGRDILHTGTIAALGRRPVYIGVGGWGEGCTVSRLSAGRAYLAFFNPINGPLFAVVYPYYQAQWLKARQFLQLFHGSANYLYAGFFDRGHFGEPVAFAIFARRDGSLSDFENALPEVARRLEELVERGVVKVPAVAAEIEARRMIGMAGQWKAPEAVADKRQWLAVWRNWWAIAAAERALRLGRPQAARDMLAGDQAVGSMR